MLEASAQRGLPRMLAYFQSIWKLRYFWMSLVQLDLRQRYRGSYLGVGWSLLNPLAMTFIVCVAFGTVFQTSMEEYPVFFMTGMTFWTFATQSAIQGANAFFLAETYIRQFPAPLAIYPLRSMLGLAVHYCIALGMTLGLSVVMIGLPPPLAVLSLLPTLMLIFLFCWSMSVLFGIVTVMFRDIRYLLEIAFQMLFYLTPILYEPKLMYERNLGFIIHLNPMVPFLDLLRAAVVHNQTPSLLHYAQASVVVVITATVASLLLWRNERRLIYLL